ncbi:hypothetical protein EFZ10_03180 [Tatumella sp. TA1]|uniref:hypothetical protein n=1 Tax=Rosenbergiella collisarenosi TaxID=1544695 RepID=UPI0008F8F24B|nr:hypothetical protein [Rosenbergiella collisarenosi]MBT0722570.1 hypothetical protein [Rosenbergiella collisarenosi]QGX90731.1 hypothetical protein EFZ10_03180 [Tatumella sp. TA1]
MNRPWLFGILLFLCIFKAAAGKAQGRVECFVFIDAAIPAQLALFKHFNREYYSSPTLQQLGSMTFINIGLQPLANTTTVPLINDTTGIWVRKFKPQSLPAMFSMHQGKPVLQALKDTREMRQCLQGQ